MLQPRYQLFSGKCGAPRRAGGRDRERRLQPEIEASLRSQPDGFSVSNSLHTGSRSGAHSRADGCALASARERANQGSDTSAAANGLCRPLTAASALLGPLAGVDVIALAPGTDFGDLQHQLRVPAEVAGRMRRHHPAFDF